MVFPVLAYEECIHVLVAALVKKRLPADEKRDWRRKIKETPGLLGDVLPDARSFGRELESLGFILAGPDHGSGDTRLDWGAVVDDMHGRMGSALTLGKDALMIEQARHMGVLHLASMDGDWLGAEGFTLFVPR